MSCTRIPLYLLLALLLTLLAGSPALGGKKGSRSLLKLKIQRPKGKSLVGETASIRVKVRNRTRDPQTARLVLQFEGANSPVHEETLSLESREKRRFEIPIQLPGEYLGSKLKLTARFEDGEDEDETNVKMRAPEDGACTPDDWERGRDLFLANCAACHDPSDREIRDEDLDDWLEAVREGEDDMPSFPGLSATDVRLMREYALDPDRGEGPSDDDADWLRGRELFAANCAACHGDRGNDIRHEDSEDWREAVREGEDDMPPFPAITNDDVRDMRKYVLDPDRVVDEPPAPPPPPADEITYEGSVKAILTSRCTACHNQSNARGSIRLDDYATAFANRVVLVDSVVKDRMPPGSALATDTKDILKAWLDAGAPER